MGRDLASVMDDTGFTAVIGSAPAGAAPRTVAPVSSIAPARGQAWRPSRAWVGGVVFALVAHVGFFASVALNRGRDEPMAERPPMTIFVDMTPRAPIRRAAPKTPPAAEAQPRPTPPSRPLPFTPRQPLTTAPPPPTVSPLPAPPPAQTAPAPAVEPVRAAPEPAAAQSPNPSPEFLRRVLAALEQVRRYPPAAKARREEGVVVLVFSMNRSGRVTAAQVQKSSGSASLDRAALEAVRRARLPAVPAEYTDPLQLVLPVEFSLG